MFEVELQILTIENQLVTVNINQLNFLSITKLGQKKLPLKAPVYFW